MNGGRTLMVLVAACAPLACGGDGAGGNNGGSGGPTDPGPADPSPAPAVGEIVGSVRGDGAGIRDVDLVLYAAGSSTTGGAATTDDDGYFAFTSVDAGDWEVEVLPPAATEAPQEARIPVTVTGGGSSTVDIELALLPVSLALHVQPVFTAQCAGCHSGTRAPAGLVLTEGDTYAATVGVPAGQLASMARIEPGEPDDSYLVHKIEGTHEEVGGGGHRMPPGSLRARFIDLIRRWTAEGATNN